MSNDPRGQVEHAPIGEGTTPVSLAMQEPVVPPPRPMIGGTWGEPMRRFDDILKLLLGLLIGQLFREMDTIGANLRAYFRTGESEITRWIPILLTGLFLRNLHASIRYDHCTSRERFRPGIEDRLWGRILIFSLSVSAVFISPYYLEHLLSSHLTTQTSDAKVVVALVAPLVIYAVWDTLIWLTTREDHHEGVQMLEVVHNWIKLDFVGLGVAVLAGVHYLYNDANGIPFARESLASWYALLLVITILLDYVLNAQFYFPAPPHDSRAEPIRDQEVQPGRGASAS